MRIREKLYFSPNFKFTDLDWSNSGKLIDAFEDRVLGFYLAPTEKLCNNGDGFASGVLCATAIDFVARIETGEGAVGPRVKKWLSSHIGAFGQTSSDTSNKTFAELFYLNFRNGLVHEGRIKKLGQFSFDESEIVSMKDGVMLVNPRLLLTEVRSAFLRYCEKLRSEESIFNEFRRNLIRDFREEVNWAKRLPG
jgi:hypothetical protein